uniref:AlNc14C146G7389 protein n=1 Tax=Albugo laibachii Nc14 TaxID=890382 RepID=F0WLK2_9STRA|nr:AlNc14C146G7389 [Albugo laibachii Nc14]|eukprot:CCA22166.1 AlNc14C146G7389 [Albugo laibachii Nc14]
MRNLENENLFSKRSLQCEQHPPATHHISLQGEYFIWLPRNTSHQLSPNFYPETMKINRLISF